MKAVSIATLLPALLMAAPASAQTVAEDVRCFLLSNVFAKGAKENNVREISSASLSFYLGRIDGKASSSVIADALVKQGATIEPKTASAQMAACAARMARAQQSIQALAKPLIPKK